MVAPFGSVRCSGSLGQRTFLYPGSATILGLINDKEHRVRLVIDEDVFKEEMFGCHPCENTSSIRFATRDLTEKILPALGIEPVIVHLVGHDE